ncbi:O-antigen polysaccharide polymerase Wzy [Neomoorella humiferrea]
MSFLASIGIFLGCLLSHKFIRISNDVLNSLNKGGILFIVGTLFFGLGMVLFFADFQRVGGFFYAISLSRGLRMSLLSQTRGNLPYQPFVMSGIAFAWLGYFLRPLRIKRIIAFSMLAIWLILMLIQGDRRMLTYSLIIIFGLYCSIKNVSKIKLNSKGLFIMVIIYLSFMSFAQLRWLFTPLIRGEISIQQALSWISSNASVEWILPGINEFGGPYFTLLYSIEKSSNPLYGSSYLSAIPNLLPRSLYPGEKPPTIAQDFALHIYELYTPSRESVIGWGYSPVAEAFNNFGIMGTPIVFIVITFIWALVGQMQRYGTLGLLSFSLLLPQTLNMNRIDFSSSFMEAVYSIFVGLIGYIMCMILKGNFSRR